VAENVKPWERLETEPNRWFQRFERFRLLGPDRSILATCNVWRLEKSREVSSSSPKSWREMAAFWHWKERAEAWDQYLSDQVSEAAQAERIRILTSGYALRHERVRVLNELAALLLGEANEQDKRWLPDVKSIGSGEMAERVDIVRFNTGLIEQARKTLEDLAAELGERIKNVDIKSGGEKLPSAVVNVYIPDNGRDDEPGTPIPDGD